MSSSVSLQLSVYVFGDRTSQGTWNSQAKLGWLAGKPHLRDPFISASPALKPRIHILVDLALYVVAGNRNSGPDAYEASTLLMEPSLQSWDTLTRKHTHTQSKALSYSD